MTSGPKKSARTCVTCQWYNPDFRNSIRYSQCLAPENQQPSVQSLVDPDIPVQDGYRWMFCDSQREDGWIQSLMLRTCGRRGRWWTERWHSPEKSGDAE